MARHLPILPSSRAASPMRHQTNYIFDVLLLHQEVLSLIRTLPNLAGKAQLFGLLVTA